MKNKAVPSTEFKELRRQAEERLGELKRKTAPKPSQDANVQKFIHELEIHQIELEMQNDDLMQARAELEASLRRYTDIYDFSPVGYFTLARDGAILQVNLTGASLLGVERGKLIKKHFRGFVSIQSRATFNAFFERVYESHQMETCEVAFQNGDLAPLWMHIEAKADPSLEEDGVCQAVVIDITGEKRADKEIQDLAKFPSENPNPILRIGRDGNLIYINEAGLSLLSQWNLQVGQASPPVLQEAVFQTMDNDLSQTVDLEFGERVYSFHIAPIIAAGYANLYGHDITDQKLIENTLLFLLESGYSDEDFFESLARYLATSLEMDYVCIDRLSGDLLSAETVAVYFDGKFEANVEYNLKDTPCGDVVEKTVCVFPNQVRHLFPQDVVLQEMLAESYVGTTLMDAHGKPIGLIAAIGRKPLVNSALAESVLKLVSVRAAGELERKQAEEALRYLSTHDTLTGLYNRAFFEEEMGRLERGRLFPVSIVMADVDYLKRVNDQHGHAAGDELLKRVAQVLTAAFRAEDVVARLGGDEFAVLLPGADATAANDSLQRVRQAVQKNNEAGPEMPICLSLGLSTAEKTTSLSDVLKEADKIMYHEKRGLNG